MTTININIMIVIQLIFRWWWNSKKLWNLQSHPMYHTFKSENTLIWNISFMVSHTVYFTGMVIFTLTSQIFIEYQYSCQYSCEYLSTCPRVQLRVLLLWNSRVRVKYKYQKFITRVCEYEYRVRVPQPWLSYVRIVPYGWVSLHHWSWSALFQVMNTFPKPMMTYHQQDPEECISLHLIFSCICIDIDYKNVCENSNFLIIEFSQMTDGYPVYTCMKYLLFKHE